LLNAGDESRTNRPGNGYSGGQIADRTRDNPLGEPVDGKGSLAFSHRLPIERPAHAIMDRAMVSVPLQTGLKVIDALIPIGRGTAGIDFGRSPDGKTAIAI